MLPVGGKRANAPASLKAGSSTALFSTAGFSTAKFLIAILSLSISALAFADENPVQEGISSREARDQAIRSVPFQKLNRGTSDIIRSVVENPSFYRRMPTQQIECDPQMFTFLVRRPEVLVNIWDMMGITQVSARRTSPFSFFANDGVGTSCKCDLVYGSDDLHIYFGKGNYDGSMTPRGVDGRCVCILRTQTVQDASGKKTVAGVMDVFLKLDNFGADILTRTFAPFVGKTADYNFVETAKFMAQVSQICTHNPAAAQGLAMRLDKVDANVRAEFASIAARIAANDGQRLDVDRSPSRDALSDSNPVGGSSNPVNEGASDARNDPPSLRLSSSSSLRGEASETVFESSRFQSQNQEQPHRSAEPLQLIDESPEARTSPSAIRPTKSNIYMRR